MASIPQVAPLTWGTNGVDLKDGTLVTYNHAGGYVAKSAGVPDGITIGDSLDGLVAVRSLLDPTTTHQAVSAGTIAKGAFVKSDANGLAVVDASGTATTNCRARFAVTTGQTIVLYYTAS